VAKQGNARIVSVPGSKSAQPIQPGAVITRIFKS
jgi:hypothetical protein